LQIDWGLRVFGLGNLLAGFAKRVGTAAMRKRRNSFNAVVAGPIGDILLYQSHGAAIRKFIRQKVETAEPPVTLVAHSLGGIACVDLLALAEAPTVEGLVTIGSQVSFFYEIDALTSVRQPLGLPQGYPRWLNIYDRNDFLSFIAARLFAGRVEDFECESGTSFPESHSAYMGNPQVWARIAAFIA
jgi:pimeloyl-ACP methyl ester carboxylesterase